LPLDQARSNELCFEQLRAVETVDACLDRIWQRLNEKKDQRTAPTHHRTEPVPFMLVDDPAKTSPRPRIPGHCADASGRPGRGAAEEMSGRDLRVT
jgi:hypothetical protein